MNSKNSNTKSKKWDIPRRNVVKSIALMTGAYLTGVFRLDEALGQSRSCYTGSTHEEKCCHLCCTHDNGCRKKTCASKLSWVCPHQEENGPPEIYKCLECYSIDVRATPKQDSCRDRQLCHDVICSQAIGPTDRE